MKIPPGKTEAEVLKAIEKAANILAPSFVFGSYDVSDIKQHCYVAAIEALDKDKYNPEMPLENFLYACIRNALVRLKRDKYRRNDPPCKRCHAGEPCQDAGHARQCPKYKAWFDRNAAKANLANPISVEHVSDERERRARAESRAESDAEIAELLQRIDEQLPVELRATYLQMRAGVSVSKGKRLQVEAAVKDILKGAIEACPSEDD
jgi:DNA-directed RNA polymerase specialized sigma24 family protein